MIDAPLPYPIHPLAAVQPPLRKARYQALVASVKQYGLLRPIVIWREQIVDGVHRLQACLEVGVEPEYKFLDDDADLLEFFATEGLPFREMNNNSRALMAHYLSQWSTRGRPSIEIEEDNSANLRIKQKEAAVLVGVSVRLVSDASRVLSEDSEATPALRQAADKRMVNVSDAARVVDRPPEMQERAVELVIRKEVRTVRAAVERIERELSEAEESEALAGMLARPLDETVTLYVAQVADLLQSVTRGSVDAVIAHPPAAEEHLYLLSDLSDLAAHALKPTGCMVVVGSGMLLPQMMAHLEHQELRCIGEFDLLFRGPPTRSGRPHFINLHRRPLLIYGQKAFRLECGDDLIEVPAPEELPPGLDRNEAAMRLIVERFCRPGQTVCDPWMLDRAGTALACRGLGCTFIGATERPHSRDRIRVRLAQEDDRRDQGMGGDQAGRE